MTMAKPGTVVSHYRLLEPLGTGGMGEVWLAEDTQLPRRLAVKLLSPHLSEKDTAVQRMAREAAATASIDHPAVATIFETGEFEGRPFLAMQYFEGQTLESRIAEGPFEVREALTLVREITDALAEVHALGIVHRDLKPGNIMLTPRGPRILDFGLASIQATSRLTAAGTTVGTPAAMSPEQLRGGPVDNRTDLWALGVLLYEMLTGGPPFTGDSTSALFQRILTENPDRPGTLRPEIGPDLDQVVMKLLRKDPAHRYPRAEDLLADLAACLAQEETPSDGVTVVLEAAADSITRLAVVPFEVMSADPDDGYLAAGLVEDLIVDLTRIQGLYVPSRGEVATYAGRNVPPRTLARELGVDYVLLGSVRRLGNRARISAHLVRAADGSTLWAERFDRTLEDLFLIQEEVSKQIVSSLEIALRPEEREMLGRAPTTDTEAYTLYLRARDLMDTDRESNLRAERLLKDALEIDSKFALAHAALAQVYVLRPSRWWGGLEHAERAQECIRKALEIEPDLPDAVRVDLMARILEGDHGRILEAIHRVLAVCPDDASAMEFTAWGYMIMKRPEDAVPILKRQTSKHLALSLLRTCYQLLGRKEDEERVSRMLREILVKRIERDPELVHDRSLLAGMLAKEGDTETAVFQAERAVAIDPKDGRARYNAACTYAILGKSDKALEHLREAVGNLPSFVAEWPKTDPDLESVRGLPEWGEIFGRG